MDLVKMSKIQMYFWFICSGVTLILVAYLYFSELAELEYFLIPLTCVVLAFLRRWQFKRLSKSAAERDAKSGKNKKKKN